MSVPMIGPGSRGVIQAPRMKPSSRLSPIFIRSSRPLAKPLPTCSSVLRLETEGVIRSTFPLPASDKGRAPTPEGEPFDRLPPTLRTVRLWLGVRLWEEWNPTKATPESTLSWRKEFLREFDETDNDEHPLGNLPVVVVSSSPIASEAERKSRDGAAARLGSLSSNTVHVTATGSGHEIHLYRPDLVVQGLLCAVVAVRNHAALACS